MQFFRHFDYIKTDIIFEISDPENPQVTNIFVKIMTFRLLASFLGFGTTVRREVSQRDLQQLVDNYEWSSVQYWSWDALTRDE